VITTFAMVTLLCVFLGFRRIRPFTPAIFPILYAVMVYAESPISGTSAKVAKLYHFDSDRDRLFRRTSRQIA
jgi:aquaporin Z